MFQRTVAPTGEKVSVHFHDCQKYQNADAHGMANARYPEIE